MRYIAFILFFWCISWVGAYAQHVDTASSIPEDTVTVQPRVYRPHVYTVLDSVAAAMRARERQVSDSLSMIYIQQPDTGRHNQFVDQMFREHVYKGYGFLSQPSGSGHLVR